ncbi:toxic polypeptide, small (modular protein) [Escherichia coli]|nr:toxic polypeptide, small (modular protein) [Escherichia coli]
MLTKYALVAIIVLCCTVLGFTLMVGDSLCELSIRERGMEFKAVLAYESRPCTRFCVNAFSQK